MVSTDIDFIENCLDIADNVGIETHSKDHPDNEYPSIQSSEVDMIGHALDDRLLLEAETGEQGILNMIL